MVWNQKTHASNVRHLKHSVVPTGQPDASRSPPSKSWRQLLSVAVLLSRNMFRLGCSAFSTQQLPCPLEIECSSTAMAEHLLKQKWGCVVALQVPSLLLKAASMRNHMNCNSEASERQCSTHPYSEAASASGFCMLSGNGFHTLGTYYPKRHTLTPKINPESVASQCSMGRLSSMQRVHLVYFDVCFYGLE